MDILDQYYIVWEETEHSWNELGAISNEIPKAEVSVDAKVIATWRKRSIRKFLADVTEAISEIIAIATGESKIDIFISLITLLNTLPLNFKLVWNDNEAELFLRLIKEDRGDRFFLKKDIERYHEDIGKIIHYFIEKGVLVEEKDRYVINGSVLNKSTLFSS